MEKDRPKDSKNDLIKDGNTSLKKEIEPHTRNVEPIDIKSNNGLSKMNTAVIKRLSISILSALLIGSMLGFIMIKMITNIDMNVDGNSDVVQATLNNNDSNEGDTSVTGLGGLDAYVLQVGMFSEISNVEEWSEKFNQAGIQTVTWEKEGNYFLLAGLSLAEEQAKISADKIKESEFDVFVKEWKTNDINKIITAEEQQWIKSFVHVWKETLGAITKNELYLSDGWVKLIDHYPEESNEIKQIVEVIQNHEIQNLANMDEQDKEYVLLDIWQHYEVTFN